jgi:hypothetical protein
VTLEFSSRTAVPQHVLVRQLERESVLLNLDTERYFGLDEVGTRMWLHLTSSDSIEAAYQKLLSEYEVDGEILRRNLTELLDQLVANGLLDVVSG